jgi:hypothetical protein
MACVLLYPAENQDTELKDRCRCQNLKFLANESVPTYAEFDVGPLHPRELFLARTYSEFFNHMFMAFPNGSSAPQGYFAWASFLEDNTVSARALVSLHHVTSGTAKRLE